MRSRTVLIYGLALLVAGIAAVGCGDTEDRKPSGSAGKGGGGSSSGGKSGGGSSPGGKDGSAGSESPGGETTGGTGVVNNGGTDQGLAGMGVAGGQGGMGEVSPCGNGMVDPGEWCDGSDGCSDNCMPATCNTCVEQNIPPVRPFVVGDCATLSAGDQPLCQAVLDCIQTSDCVEADKTKSPYRAALPCYCGELGYEACSNAASSADLTGDCKTEINAASKLGDALTPAAVLVRFEQVGSPVWAAMTQANDPGPLPQGCERMNTPDERQKCREVLVCLYRTNCATDSVNDGTECYCGSLASDECFLTNDSADPGLNGACKDEIQRAAGGAAVAPLTIGQQFYQVYTPVGAAMSFSLKIVDSCKDECFSFGAGGSAP